MSSPPLQAPVNPEETKSKPAYRGKKSFCAVLLLAVLSHYTHLLSALRISVQLSTSRTPHTHTHAHTRAAGFVVIEGAAPTDEQVQRRERDAIERSLEEARVAKEASRQKRLELLEEVVVETETVYERLIEEKQPFEGMVQELPADYVLQHAATGAGLRVVLDAANIGYSTTLPADLSSSATSKPLFDVQAVEQAVGYFSRLGMHVVAFLPAAFVKKRLSQARKTENSRMVTDDVEALFELVLKKVITLVPAGADDDLYILHYARKHCCFIVSNDFYADHIARHEERMGRQLGKSMRLWIDTNRSSYVFVQGQFMLTPTSALALAVEHIERGLSSVLTPLSPASAFRAENNSNQNVRGIIIPAVINELSSLRCHIGQLTAQYRHLLHGGMGGDGRAIWTDCESLLHFIDEETAAAKAELMGLMNDMQRMHAMLHSV